MKKNNIILFCLVLLAFADNSCKKNEYKNLDCSSINSTYQASILPIISANCTMSNCHSSGSSNGDLTSYTNLASKANNGQLDSYVLTKKSMPPSGALSLDDRKKIKCWINSGAPNN